MSYIDRKQDPRRRANAIVAVATVHAVLAIGLLKGLDIDFERIIPTPFEGTQIPLDPPKSDPPPPPSVEPARDTFVSPDPRPPIELPNDTGPVREVVPSDQSEIAYFPTGDVVDPPTLPPLPRFTPKRALPSNSSSRWISNDDYPRRALIDQAEGSVSYRLVIGTNGRVASCELTRPSGNRALDDTTCRLIVSRARFEAATDETGAKVLGTYTGTVTWEIPD